MLYYEYVCKNHRMLYYEYVCKKIQLNLKKILIVVCTFYKKIQKGHSNDFFNTQKYTSIKIKKYTA